jgi:hypothetical protein
VFGVLYTDDCRFLGRSRNIPLVTVGHTAYSDIAIDWSSLCALGRSFALYCCTSQILDMRIMNKYTLYLETCMQTLPTYPRVMVLQASPQYLVRSGHANRSGIFDSDTMYVFHFPNPLYNLWNFECEWVQDASSSVQSLPHLL